MTGKTFSNQFPPRRRPLGAVSALALGAALAAPVAFAEDYELQGGGSSNLSIPDGGSLTSDDPTLRIVNEVNSGAITPVLTFEGDASILLDADDDSDDTDVFIIGTGSGSNNVTVLGANGTIDLNGADVSVSSTGRLIIGDNSGGPGNDPATLTGVGTLSVAGRLIVNDDGTIADTAADALTVTGSLSSSGTIAEDVVNNGGSVLISGGTALDLTNLTGNATISGGTLTGDLAVSGGGVTVNGTGTVQGDTSLTGGALTVSGSAVVQDIANSGGDLVVSGGNVLSVTSDDDDSETTISGGTVGAVDLSAGVVNNTVSGSISGDVSITGGTFNNNGGAATTVINDGGSVNISDGTVTTLDNQDGSSTLSGGTVTTASISGGTVTNGAGASITDVDVSGEGAFVNNGGHTGTLEFSGEDVSITISGGTVDLIDHAVAGGGTVTLSGGTVTAAVLATSGELVQTGGTLTEADIGSGASLSISDGEAGDLLSSGGSIEISGGAVTSVGSTLTGASVAISGGTVDTVANGGGDFEISGGAVTSLESTDATADTTISGGTVADIDLQDGIITNADGGSVTGDVTVGGGTFIANGGTGGDFVIDGGELALSGGNVTSVDAQSGSFNFTGGTVTGDVSVNGAALTLSGIVEGTLDVNSAVEIAGGTYGDIDIASGVTVDGSGSFEVEDDFVINGTLDMTSSATVDVGGDVSLNGGTITNSGSGTNTIAVDGDFISTGTVDAVAGQVNIEADTIFLDSGASLTGRIELLGDIDNDITLDFGAIGQSSLAGDITNNAGATLALGSALNGGGHDIINDGAVTITAANTNFGTLTNQNSGTVSIGATGAFGGDIDVTGGTVSINGGTVTGDISVGGGTLTMNNGAAGDVILNSGELVASGSSPGGGLISSLEVNGGSAELLYGASVSGETTVSGGTFDLTGGRINDLTNEGGEVTLTDGYVTGTIENTAGQTISVSSSTVYLNEIINDSGIFELAGGNVSGLVTNNGTGEMTVTNATLTGGMDVNGGSVTIGSGALISTQVLTVDGTTVIIETGAAIQYTDVGSDGGLSVAGDATFQSVTNAGDVIIDGGVNFVAVPDGILINESGGTLLVDGQLGSELTADAGSFTTVNGMIGPDLNGGDIEVINNSDDFFLNDARIVGNFRNTAFATVDGEVTVTGAGNNSGTIGLQDGAIGDVLTFGGNLASSGGTIEFDVDLSTSTGTGDEVVVNGAVTGNMTLSFVNIGAGASALDGGGLKVLSYGSSSASYTPEGLDGLSVAYYYALSERADGVYLVSLVNPGISGITGGLALTQSLISSVVNRPSTPFVIGPADVTEPCGLGTWTRTLAGSASSSGTSTESDGITTTTYPADIDAFYYGMQVGTDFGCYGGAFDGWDLTFGGILGVNSGTTTQNVYPLDGLGNQNNSVVDSVTEMTFDQLYAGAYVVASKGRFSGEMQLRGEQTDFVITNDPRQGTGLDFDRASFSTTAYTVSGSASYVFTLSEERSLFLTPIIGFAYTATEAAEIDLGMDRRLEIDESTTEIGYVSAAVTKSTILPDDRTRLTYIGTGTVYHDFAPAHTSTYYDSAVATGDELEHSNLGTYVELSAGINWDRLLQAGDFGNAKQISATARLDGRFGESLESWGLTAQVRIQF